METNLIKFNTYKLERGGLLVPMYDQYNARVGDQGTPLVIQWTEGTTDTPVNLQRNNLHFYAAGQVGKYLEKLDDDTGYKMSADASSVEYDDKDSVGSQANGLTVAKLPKQFFPQEGIFYGYFGLKDDQGNTYTSVNVWFRVLGGVPIMGAAIPYFSTRFDELMETCQGRIEDALAQLRQEYQAEVKKNEDMSDETRAALSKLADAVGAIQAQIDAGNVVTLIQHNADIKRTSEMIENKLAQMSLIPEAFENSDAIKKAYPNGKTGIMVAVDTGHKWIWFNSQWNDCGVYQSEGNAEVEDARKWAKIFGSKTSDSLAESIQGQDLEVLKTIFSKIEEPNISAPISDSAGYYVDYLSGAIKTYTPNGGSTAVTSVNLEPGALYVIMSGLTFHPENHTEIGNGYAFYDENGAYIEGQRQINSVERAIVPLGARSLKITATGNSSVTVFYGLTCIDESLAIKGRIPDAQSVGDGIKLALDGSDAPITTFRWSDGYFINNQNGVLYPNQSFSYTDLTPVYGSHQLYIRSKSRVLMAFFDTSKKFVSGIDVNSTSGIFFKKIEIPKNAVYARFSVDTSTKNSLKVQFNPDYPSLNRGVGGHEDIDFGSWTSGDQLGISGALVPNAEYSYSDVFFMKPSQPVWISAGAHTFFCEYDENGGLVRFNELGYQNNNIQQLITTSDRTVFAMLATKTDMSSELRITYDIEGREYHVGEGEKYTKILDAIEEATRYMSSKVYVHQGTYNLIDKFGADFFNNYSSSSPVGIMLKNKVHVIFENAKVTFMYDGSNQEVIARFSPFNSSVFGFTLENLDIECQNCRYAVHDERGATSDSYSSTYKNCHIVNHGVGGSKHYCIGAGLGHNATFTVKNCILDGLGLLIHNDYSADDNLAKSKIIISGNYFGDGANIELEHTGGSTEMTEAIVSANSLTNSNSLCLQQNPYKYVRDNVKLYAFANEFRTKGESSPGKTDVDASTSTSAGASESTSTATSQA